MIKCPACGKEILADVSMCPFCRHELALSPTTGETLAELEKRLVSYERFTREQAYLARKASSQMAIGLGLAGFGGLVGIIALMVKSSSAWVWIAAIPLVIIGIRSAVIAFLAQREAEYNYLEALKDTEALQLRMVAIKYPPASFG